MHSVLFVHGNRYDSETPFGTLTVSQYIELHRQNPQPRLIRRAAAIVRDGGLIAYPTDSCYALGCHIGDAQALERLRRIRGADRHHHFSLVCRNLHAIGRYARLDTWQFRLLKAQTPGPFTFLLPATRETPRRLQHPKRRTVGIRVPDHIVPQLLLQELGEPLMSSHAAAARRRAAAHRRGRRFASASSINSTLILDGGPCGVSPTTVIDLASTPPAVVRLGSVVGPGCPRSLRLATASCAEDAPVGKRPWPTTYNRVPVVITSEQDRGAVSARRSAESG